MIRRGRRIAGTTRTAAGLARTAAARRLRGAAPSFGAGRPAQAAADTAPAPHTGQCNVTRPAAAAMLLILLAFHPLAAPGVTPGGAPVSGSPLGEDDAQRNLHETERLRNEQLGIGKDAADRAERAAAEAARLAQERVVAAAKLQQADAATADIAARIDALAAQRREAETRLQARAAAMQPLLPLIERLSLYPVETLLAVPGSPETTLRGVLVLKGLSRQMEIESQALRQDQAALDAAGAALAREAPRLAAAQAAQAQQAARLDQQIAAAHAEREQAEAETTEAATRAAVAATKMDTLRAAITALEAEQRAAAAVARAAAARALEAAERAERQQQRAPDMQTGPQRDARRATQRMAQKDAQRAAQREAMLVRPPASASITAGAAPAGQLQAPVIGVVVKGWGEATDGGPATGVYYHAPPGARVISPCGGRVVFADGFRSYGLLLIVDCGGGYHVVLAGFDRLDIKLGQSIVAGEPVGVMPAWEPGSTARRPALYVELRHDGQPVNPAPWLKSRG